MRSNPVDVYSQISSTLITPIPMTDAKPIALRATISSPEPNTRLVADLIEIAFALLIS